MPRFALMSSMCTAVISVLVGGIPIAVIAQNTPNGTVPQSSATQVDAEGLANVSRAPASGSSPTDASATYAFELKTPDGVPVSVDVAARVVGGAADEESMVSGTVVCFLGTECPLVRLYSVRLSQMARDYAARGIRFVGINSNRQDTLEDMERFQSEHSLSFPLVRDERNVVADRYGATRTPEVFLLDDRLNLLYQGRIDDQYEPGISRPAALREDLREAIDQLLAGEPVAVKHSAAVGCLIGKYKRTNQPAMDTPVAVTYSKEVSRVLQKHCLECHRQGEIGPFSMERFDDVVGWAPTMLETIEDGRMPPWHADPNHGQFKNSRLMTEAEKQILKDWVAAGMPEGNRDQLPPPVQFSEGWQLPREPDLIVSMRESPYHVPAEGTVEYQYFVIDPGFTEDRWVSASQVIPGNRSVVHHAIVFIRPPDGYPMRGVGWLTAYVPGQRSFEMPAGYARKIPAGSKLVFQMHYTTNGIPQQDITQVGMVFADPQKITHEVITVVGIDQEFEIPPHAAHHEVKGQVRWFPKRGKLLGVAPHMHVRGKQFRLTAERDGESQVLLHVPRYDFNWQHAYELQQPLDLAEVDRMRFTAVFDNSEDNPFNPDPTQWVNWGDQTWEEMAVAFLEVAEPLQPGDAATTVADASIANEADSSDLRSVDRERRVTEFVDDFFRRLDTNGDGIITRSEVPLAVRTHFRRFDMDGDNTIVREDVIRVARERITE